MPNDLIHKIEDALLNQQQSISALDIAQHFLHMTNVTESAAETIVDHLFKSHAQFHKDEAGLWTIERKADNEDFFSFVLCQVFPERAQNSPPLTIHLAKFVDDDFRDIKSFIVDSDNIIFVSENIHKYIAQFPLLFDGFGNQQTNFNWLLAQTVAPEPNRLFFSLSKIVKKLFPDRSIVSRSDISKVLDEPFHEGDADATFDSLMHRTQRVVELLHEQDIKNSATLHDYLLSDVHDINFDLYSFDESFLHTMSLSPGVYVMRDQQDNVIYVGKAKSLRRRLMTYFSRLNAEDEKLKTIRDQLYSIEIIELGSELEALLKEYELIQYYNPPINRQFDVHPRADYTRERYEQILFLPSMNDEVVNVFPFNPAGRFKMLSVDRNNFDHNNIKLELGHVFAEADAEHSAKVEIITSWLSRNADYVSSLDMRTIASMDEAVRLIEQNVINFKPDEKQLFQ